MTPRAATDDECLGTAQIVAYLDGALPPRDRALVEAHLASCDDCRELVSALVPAAAPTSDDPGIALARTDPSGRPPAPATSLAPKALVAVGDLVSGKYRVTRKLGQGGMGLVMAAEHVVLRTPVALKFLLTTPDLDRQASARFLREARVSARLSSEHIARVLDYGLLAGSGVPYLVIEYLDGEDLGALLERGPIPLASALDLLLQACEGLAVAHRAGVVHRDLKPANLFVTRRDGGAPLVKLLDFGIAKADRFDTHGAPGMTTGEAFLGSPRYASPEQLQSARSVDARTDVWSIGCVAYELLTGRPAFDGDSLTNLIAAILTTEPAPPRRLRPDLPAAIEDAVLRCLAKAPEKRPTIAELAVALAPFATEDGKLLARRIASADPAVALAPASPQPPSARPAARSHRLPWLVVAAGVLVLVPVGVLFATRSPSTSPPAAAPPAVASAVVSATVASAPPQVSASATRDTPAATSGPVRAPAAVSAARPAAPPRPSPSAPAPRPGTGAEDRK